MSVSFCPAGFITVRHFVGRRSVPDPFLYCLYLFDGTINLCECHVLELGSPYVVAKLASI